MLGAIEIITEHHPNGALWFITERAFIEPMFEQAYRGNTNLRYIDEKPFLILKREKHFDNGQFGWCLKWDKQGILLNKNDKTYRKDGTIILH